jgi:hypothetical protein
LSARICSSSIEKCDRLTFSGRARNRKACVVSSMPSASACRRASKDDVVFCRAQDHQHNV